MPRLRFPAALDRLDEARTFVTGAARELGLADDAVGRVELVLEEALVNVIKHAYRGGPGEIELACSMDAGSDGHGHFVVEIRDTGPAFDPLQGPPPDLESGLENRPIGGLGIHLMRQMTSHMAWERQEPHNVLRLCFAAQPTASA